MSEPTETEEKNKAEGAMLTSLLLAGAPPEPELRKFTLIGDVTEETSEKIISTMLYLHGNAKVEELVEPENPDNDETEEVVRPFEFIISTNGGSADEMFAIYDIMRYVREEVDIETYGIGKVMSAGTLLLAAGTKGKRKIGKHCRVMIHSVIGGSVGPMHQLDNEMREIRSMQEAYITAICNETNLTEKKLRSILKRKVNVYLTAEEAVEHGFADIIV